VLPKADDVIDVDPATLQERLGELANELGIIVDDNPSAEQLRARILSCAIE